MTISSAQVAVLGSTGSIGQSTLDVIAASQGRFTAAALVARRSFERLVQQAQTFHPRWVVAIDAQASADFDWSGLPSECQLLTGQDALEELVARPEIDTVVAAIVGAAGLRSTWRAIEAGKKVALANKETLVMAGPLVMELAKAKSSTILPIDSEHSAIFQSLAAGRREDLRRVILTASGGPFRQHSAEQLARVTVEDALEHPTWSMGKKITIDSATLMNKALEMIEARWLFDLRPDQIEVVIHPQSIVHSMVEYVDGSVVAQLSPPDMKLPIQYALTYPQRSPGIAAKMDWSERMNLEFSPPDFERFPALGLGLDVARRGGSAGAVFNAANEAAVESFLAGELDFVEIVPLAKSVLEHHEFDARPTLERLIQLDDWARKEVLRWVCT